MQKKSQNKSQDHVGSFDSITFFLTTITELGKILKPYLMNLGIS